MNVYCTIIEEVKKEASAILRVAEQLSEPSVEHAFKLLSACKGKVVLTGMGNVVLDWPLVAAVLHTGGAGALVVVLVWLLAATGTQETLERAASTRPSYAHD